VDSKEERLIMTLFSHFHIPHLGLDYKYPTPEGPVLFTP